MGLPQLLIVGGAVVLLLIDILLGMVAGEYFIGDLGWLAAGAILLGMLLSRRSSNLLPFAYNTILLVGALIIAIVGVRGILFDLVSVLRSPSSWNAIELMGLLLFAAATVAVAWGGWMLLRGRR